LDVTGHRVKKVMVKGTARTTVGSRVLAALGRLGLALRVDVRCLLLGVAGAALCLFLGMVPAHAEQDGTGSEIIPIGVVAGNKLDVGTGKFIMDGVSGNVGIGSSVPQLKLDVEGSVYVGNGNIGVASSAPGQKIDVAGTVRATAFVGDGAGLTGLPGGWTRTGTNVYVTTSTDNVGIGTSTPFNGWTDQPSPGLHIEGTDPKIGFYDNSGGGNRWSFLANIAGFRLYNDTANQYPVTILNSGNVGIGTTQPQAKLDVQGSVYVGNGNMGIGTSAAGARLAVSANTSGYQSPPAGTVAHFLGTDADNAVFNVDAYAGSPMVIGRRANTTAGSPSAAAANSVLLHLQGRGYGSTAYSTGRAGIFMAASQSWTDAAQGTYMVFQTTPNGSTAVADVMRIDNAGNVGINSSVPQAKLVVDGGIYQSNANVLWGLNSGNVGIGTTGPNQKVHVYAGASGQTADASTNLIIEDSTTNYITMLNPDASSGALVFANPTSNVDGYVSYRHVDGMAFGTNATERIRITHDGNVGFGTTVALAKVELIGTGTTSTTASLVIRDSTMAVKIRVLDNGNVGLGSSAPLSKLDIVGNAYVNGNVGIGSSAPLRPLDVAGVAYFSGNVGIGSTAPGAKLVINNTANFSVFYDNGSSGASKTIDWNNGNKQKVTITASCTFTFTAPAGPVNVLLMAVHTNNATVYTETWPSGSPGDVLWPSNTAPILTDTSNAVDIISCFYNGTDYYCQAGMNFQ
jgi:hypothetical protein